MTARSDLYGEGTANVDLDEEKLKEVRIMSAYGLVEFLVIAIVVGSCSSSSCSSRSGVVVVVAVVVVVVVTAVVAVAVALTVVAFFPVSLVCSSMRTTPESAIHCPTLIPPLAVETKEAFCVRPPR